MESVSISEVIPEKPARKPRAKRAPAASLSAREKAATLFLKEHPDCAPGDLVITKSRSRKVITVKSRLGNDAMTWTYDALAAPPKRAAPKKRATQGEAQASA